ncbi:TPR end-of-group domain-containing protein [Muriicola soli]|uniref:Alpha/beta hydrolase n=1 Tax=Muriicola soli TaxID=2507538 RepID=A0A411ED76_9FLAO|nr:hypothetical protein [Muriicola soli]QBA65510.1 hypothetical protein EQY75_13815 [Muriicola soli]
MKRLLFSFFLCIYLNGVSQQLKINEGVLTDSIPVQGAADETFATYLPSSYQVSQKAPIIFIFDPAGRGKTGLLPFIEAAEEYGYILICSNNTKNGPYGPNLEITDRLFKSVFAKFTVDSNRIYTAGFSGGSRLAGTIAVLSGAIQGVIACGAGFAQYPLYFPNKNNRFSYVGIVGDKDMNFREMQKTEDWLVSLKIPNERIVFNGEHQWPPSEVMLRALGWLEEEAFRKGVKEVNSELRSKNFKDVLVKAQYYESEGQLVEASRELSRMIEYYPDLISSDSLEKRLRKLKREKRYRKEKTRLAKVAMLEDTLNYKTKERFALELSMGESPDAFEWWENTVKELKEKYASHEEPEYQLMAYRLQRHLFAMAGESMDSFLRENKVKEQEYAEKLLLVIAPDSPFTYYQLARKYAAWKKYPSALKHLEKMMQLGWTDKNLVKNTSEFQNLKTLKEFNELLERY